MPWTTPTLRQVRQMVRDDITASVQGASLVGNTVLRVVSDATAGLAALVLRYIDWLSLQLLPDTAETEWLDRQGQIWLVNADGSKGRKSPTGSQGTVSFTGTPNVLIPEGTEMTGGGVTYETLEDITLPDTTLQPQNGTVRAITTGSATNQVPGTVLTLNLPISGVDSSVTVVDLRGGTDQETDDELRARVLQRIQQPPMGGDADDYVAWAEGIPSVTRAWCAPREMGMGTVTVRFMCDALRADNQGFPTDQDVAVVYGYLDPLRPVAI
ncbi:MAG: baseplate J/gp47 family protein, partial [Rhizobiales bacterium]|nr:baseplate J/gp47 family protein [Hyphomicrobiales bacterium]